MAGENPKNWRDLCNAALGALRADDLDELLQILHQLNKALEREQRVRRDLGTVTKPSKLELTNVSTTRGWVQAAARRKDTDG